MKYSTTFAEMSEIFALIAKTEDTIGKYICAENDYNEASDKYAASGYAIERGFEMSNAYGAMLKARRAIHTCFKKLLAAFQADSNFDNDKILREEAERDYEPHRFLYAAKREAMRLAKCIEL